MNPDATVFCVACMERVPVSKLEIRVIDGKRRYICTCGAEVTREVERLKT